MNDWLILMDAVDWVDLAVVAAAPPLAVLFLLFGLDDLAVDLLAWRRGCRPSPLSNEEHQKMLSLPEKKFAILIAAWHESGVLRKMVEGNLASVRYANHEFFIGVYPNDAETVTEARLLEKLHPNVHVVMNTHIGPTSKGQMINEIVRGVLRQEKLTGAAYGAFAIHDCEDVIHPLSLKLMNAKLEEADFVQLPVFSLPVRATSWVAGTYVDEFAEAHTKDVLVRASVGAPVPSAGVGTAVSRKLVKAYLLQQNGQFLNERTLTEDYELGLMTERFGFKSAFVCHYTGEGGSRDYIATREYFPKQALASIRQKTRWTLGIAYQGAENLGWSGRLTHRYFLFRDRKGAVANIASGAGMAVFAYALARMSQSTEFLARLSWYGALTPLFGLNLGFLCNRVAQRVAAVKRVYPWPNALMSVARLPVSNVINTVAAVRATLKYAEIRVFKTIPVWAKTDHELPEGFGVPGIPGVHDAEAADSRIKSA